mgnify:CR=1 FL=1
MYVLGRDAYSVFSWANEGEQGVCALFYVLYTLILFEIKHNAMFPFRAFASLVLPANDFHQFCRE